MKKRPAITPIGPSIGYIELTRGMFALVDAEDAEMLSQVNWKATPGHKDTLWYATRNINENKKYRTERMHRVLLPTSAGFNPDHINRNGLDNRKANLRPATPSQNTLNSSIRCDNTSGVPGVTRHIQTGKWQAERNVDKKKTYLGLFNTLEEAIEAKKKAA